MVLSVGSGFRVGGLPAGVRVVGQLPRVGAVLVEAPLSAVPALRAVPGVRGVRPDAVLRTLSDGREGESRGGVLAPAVVGGASGGSGAGAGVVVAVLDTGVADTSGLRRSSGHLTRGPDFSGEDAGAARDGFGHGTFMANLIAGGAVGGNVVGVAPGASVLDVKVASADGTTRLSRVLKGLDWVAGNGPGLGVDVLSVSLGADRPAAGYGSDPLTDATDAVQAAGIVVVVAAGNDASQVSDPGQNPQLFTVGAADTTSGSKNARGSDGSDGSGSGSSREGGARVAAFSGRGVVGGVVRPDLVAPALHLLSVLPPDSVIAADHPEAKSGGLWRGSGTSQATAVTAGAVAVFLSGRAALDPQDVRASFAAVAGPVGTSAAGAAGGAGAGLLVIPSAVRRGDYHSATVPPAGSPQVSSAGGSPSWSSTSWSSTSWSSTSWSSTSWSSTSWSSTSWSSTSWSSTSWSASAWA